MEHWRDDWFFGYQCMNGSNPRMIRRCKKLPSVENFLITANMVQSSMSPRTHLDRELKAGNIYLLDCAITDQHNPRYTSAYRCSALPPVPTPGPGTHTCCYTAGADSRFGHAHFPAHKPAPHLAAGQDVGASL
ncbi:polyunsaturated fatty acid 5-lipoxygenase-like [Labrus bergylta]|uniref:polyunsaturated fatty acid 5-lipoxygenase-like n=1 Tax=Labrus bergylta TaxID=56723 RepID=UPI0033141FB3